MIVAVAGMHRSGTSMVAGALRAVGLEWGRDDELLPASADNEAGYFEHRAFIALNDRLLAAVGAAWDAPPPVHWPPVPELGALVADARALTSRFAGHELWGWKDPRNTLTLAFWRRVIPDLRIVVCLRNPLACANSLSRRMPLSEQLGVSLWQAYHEHLLATTSPEERVVTHHQAWFADPRAEVVRLCRALDLSPASDAVERAAATVRSDLRHHAPSSADLLERCRRPAVVDLYFRLCSEAGPVAGSALAEDPAGAAGLDAVVDRPGHVDALRLAHARGALRESERRLAASQQARADLSERVTTLGAELDTARTRGAALARAQAALRETAAALDAEIARLRGLLAASEGEIERQRAAAARAGADATARASEATGLAARLRDAEARLASRDADLARLVDSRTWRLVERTWRLRKLVAPPGSRRERWLLRFAERAAASR